MISTDSGGNYRIKMKRRFSKHDQIGQVLLPLGKIDLGQIIEEWKDISPPPDDKEAEKNLGDIW